MADIFSPPQHVKPTPPSSAAALAAFVAINLLTSTLSGPVQPPFKPFTFPNPVIRRVTQTDIPQNLRLTLYAVLQPPGKQLLAEVPRAKLTRFIDPDQSLQKTLFAPLIPQGKQELTVPVRRVHQRIIDPIPNLSITTLAPQIPPGKASAEIPVRSIQRRDELVPNLLTSTLSSIAPDTTNIFRELNVTKVVRPIQPQDQTVPNLLVSTLSTQAPFHQDDWPNPIVRIRQSIEPSAANLLETTLAVDYLFNEVQHTKRIVRIQPQDQTVPNLLASTLSVPPFAGPFPQIDWPNPVRSSSFREAFNPVNLLETTLVPPTPPDTTNIFRVLNITRIVPRPRTQDAPAPNLLTSTLSTPPVQPPFHQDDWPNPRLNSRFRESDNPSSLLESTLAPVEYVTRIALTSSQARRKLPQVPTFEFPNTLAILLPPAPFFQNDWPNPKRARQNPQYDHLNTTNLVNLPNPKPYHQDDWQNPVLRIYAAPVTVMSNMIVLGFPPPPPPGHGHKKHFIGEIQSLGVQEESVILDSSMGIT
jgi:hypothetical protein